MRYEVIAHIYYDGQLIKALRFEIEAESEFLAHDDALIRLRGEDPDADTIAVTAKEV